MAQPSPAFSRPSRPFLRWLLDPRRDLSPAIAGKLYSSLFAAPFTVMAGAVNGLVLNAVALRVSGDWMFAVFAALDAALVATRLVLSARGGRDPAPVTGSRPDLYLAACLGWCAVQGAMAFKAMASGLPTLQVVSAMTAVGLVGPICMRNFAAPRYAMAMVLLVLGPLACGAAASGNPWLLVLILQAPAFLLGAFRTLGQMQNLTIGILVAESESEERARKDPLTGLLNRNGLLEALDGSAALNRLASVFFYLDLDGFKSINDTHGHQVGDAVLVSVAARLTALARPGDVVARLGGDEFMIVALDLTPRDGEGYASAIIGKVTAEPYSVLGLAPLRVGISVGSACCPQDGSLCHELSRRADCALYEAKAAGKGVHRAYRAAPDTGNVLRGECAVLSGA